MREFQLPGWGRVIRNIVFTVVVLVCTTAFADIPDHILEWQSLKVIEQPGDDAVVECSAAPDGSGYSTIVFNSFDRRWNWSVLSLNRYGVETGRFLLFSSAGNLEKWVTPVFADNNTLIVFHGSRLESSPSTMRVHDLSALSPEDYTDVQLNFSGYSSVVINTALELESGSILLSGTGMDSEERTMLFTAGVDIEGNILWQRELPIGFYGFTVECAELEELYDGSFIFSYEEDGFPGGLPIYRLSSDGREMWENFIDVQSEFTTTPTGFLELPSGNILVAGSFDELGQMAFRGIFQVCDPSLFELESHEVLYDDHTFLTSLDYTEGGEVLCAGWSASDGYAPFEVENVCPLMIFIEPDSGNLLSYSIVDEPDQTPAFIFNTGIGEYLIIGEELQENRNDFDVFVGRVVVRDQI